MPAAAASNAVAIRPARPGDLAALYAIEQTAFPGDRLSRRSLRRLVTRPSAALFVAACGQTVVGYALVLFKRRSRRARLYSLAVASGHGGAGLGRALLAHAEAAAEARDCVTLTLEVRADNARAIALYRAAGYRQTGCHPLYYEDEMAALRFEKPLPSATVRPLA